MKKEPIRSGAETPYKDKDGNVIKVHDYVQDGNGTRYFINTYCQAVPEGDGAAVELSRLIEESPVTLMTIEDVLNMKTPVATRRRGGRRKKEAPAAEEKKPKVLKPKKPADTAAPAEEEHHQEAVNREQLVPVDENMVLSVFPDDVLANELRRRGYTLCAVRPVLMEL